MRGRILMRSSILIYRGEGNESFYDRFIIDLPG